MHQALHVLSLSVLSGLSTQYHTQKPVSETCTISLDLSFRKLHYTSAFTCTGSAHKHPKNKLKGSTAGKTKQKAKEILKPYLN